jgi:hypothetical protein
LDDILKELDPNAIPGMDMDVGEIAQANKVNSTKKQVFALRKYVSCLSNLFLKLCKFES